MQFAGFDARMRLVVLAGAFWATCAPLCLAQIDKAEDQYTVAASHYKGRRYALAVSEFEAFMKRYPEHARKHHARFYLAESYVQTRRLKEAEPIFDRLLTDKPDYPLANHALYRLGEIAYFREQHEVAMKRFESFVRQFPQDRLLEYVLPYQGQLYLRANKPKQAQAAYLSSLERFPNGRLYEEARMGLAQAFEVQNNFAEARRFYKSIAQNGSSQADIAALRTALTFVNQKQWRPALKELEQFCRDRGKSGVLAEATYWRGRTLSALERHDEAAKHFSEVRDRFPQHALAAESGVLAAEEYRDANQLVLAKTGLEKVLAEHRKSEWADDALQLLIEMAWDAKEYQVVGRHAERFHREFPESGLRSRVRELHGRALLATGKFEDAIELLREILAEADGVKTVAGKQDDLVARRDRYAYYLGVALLSAERFDESLKALERVKAEGNRTLRLGLYSARGAAFFGLKRFDKSIEPLQQCLKLEPKGEDATKCRLQLAIAFAEQKQWTDALDTFEQMKQLDRKHDKFLGTAQFLAERFFTGGEYKSARKLFAVLSEPGNPESYIEHGLSGKAWCDHVMSAGKGSSEGFERLIKRFPDGKLAAEAAMMRANWLEEQGQHEAAIGLYQFVVERHTQTTYAPRALLREAQIHDKQQRDLKAAELLRRLLKDYPKFDRRDSVLYTLAWVLDEGGRSEQADEVFEQLYKDHKTSKFWADATYRLAERAARSKNYDRAAELIQ